MKEFIWKVRFTFRIVTVIQTWNIKFCWNLACAGLENIGYDLTECPVECADEELSHWGY